MRLIATIVACTLLSACATASEPPVTIYKTTYVAVSPNPEFLVEDKCPWPKKTDYLKNGDDLEISDYLFAAYAAWTCEHKTRMQIGKQVDDQKKDVEAKNAR